MQHSSAIYQGNWQPQHNRDFWEKSPIPSRQLVSSLAGALWRNLCLSSCSHRFRRLCAPPAMEDNIDPVIIWWQLRPVEMREKRERRP
jgi:hypothetical protein